MSLQRLSLSIKTVLVLSGLFLMTACGGGSDEAQIPPGANVTVTPNQKSWEIEPSFDPNNQCIVFSDFYQDELFVVNVQDSQGRAIGDADLIVSLNLTANTFSGLTVVELYDDQNGDLIPDPNELVSDINDALLFTKTDEYNGSKNLIVRMNLSCPYRASLMVVADGISASADLQVISQGNTGDPNENNP